MDSPRQTRRPSGSSPAAPGAGGADRRVERPFERLVAIVSDERTASDPVPALRRLGSPSGVDRLVRATLVAAVRRGPAADHEGWGPARLLGVAGRGAQSGALPAATAPALRGLLEDLEERLHGEGLWRPDVPLWWRPLPEPRTPERVWSALEATLAPLDAGEAGGAWPSAEELAGALASPAGTGWAVIDSGLDEELVSAMHRELATLGRGDVLELARGGVGSEDRASSARSDRVAYLTGLEPELLGSAPSVATLAQWLLHGLARRVAASLATGPIDLHAPMSAMLARYAAPSRGFAPHLDNPGGEQDNARAVTVVAYLNAPHAPCSGGELSLWGPGRSGPDTGPRVVAPAGGTLALFDSRRVVHEVLPLEPGPDRWTMVVWLSDAAHPLPVLPDPPVPTPAEVLEPLGGEADDVPVPEGTVVIRTLPRAESSRAAPERSEAEHGAAVRAVPGRRARAQLPRVGIVCTTDRPGRRLEAWCRHHLALGVDHLLVVLDRPTAGSRTAAEADAEVDEVSQEIRKLAVRLDGGSGRITVWSAEEAASRWDEADGSGLSEAARQGRATHAVAARQTLNATAALVAARRGELGRGGTRASGPSLDWLLHLDDDELIFPEGRARGGASLGEHFAALDTLCREAPGTYSAVRYPNHELLLTRQSAGAARFKRNPRVGAGRLGPVGWRRLIEALEMEQGGLRPYFRAYWNGKSAVAVERGRSAAGVHGWRLEGSTVATECPLVAGPSILHVHLPSPEAFRDKYLGVAVAGAVAPSDGGRPFPPSPLEERTVGLIREAWDAGASEAELAARLDALYAEELCLGADAVELLDAAGLLFEVDLDLTPWTDVSD